VGAATAAGGGVAGAATAGAGAAGGGGAAGAGIFAAHATITNAPAIDVTNRAVRGL